MTRPIAMIFVLAGASFMSFVGVLMRLLHDATGFQILFYRSISLTLMVLAVICIRRHCTPKTLFRSIDRHDLWMGAWLALAFTSYIFSMLHTSVRLNQHIGMGGPDWWIKSVGGQFYQHTKRIPEIN